MNQKLMLFIFFSPNIQFSVVWFSEYNSVFMDKLFMFYFVENWIRRSDNDAHSRKRLKIKCHHNINSKANISSSKRSHRKHIVNIWFSYLISKTNSVIKFRFQTISLCLWEGKLFCSSVSTRAPVFRFSDVCVCVNL